MSSKIFLMLALVAGTAAAEPESQNSLSTAVDDAARYRAWALEAQDHHTGRRYEQSAALLSELVRAFPGDGRHWRMLGEAHDQLGAHGAAIRAFEKARELGTLSAAEAACRIARIHVETDEKEAAIEALRICVAAGYRFRGSLAAESHFTALSGDPSFADIAGSSPTPRLGRDEAWRQDLDFLIAELRRLHFEYRSRSFPEAFLDRARDLRQRIPQLTDSRIVVEMQRMLATLGDGHTVIVPIGMTRGILARLPIGLWWFSDGLYVVAASSEHRDLIGARVAAFGELATAEVLERTRELASHDNDYGFRWVAPVYVTFTEFLVAASAIASPERATLTFELSDGRSFVRTLTASAEVDPSTLVLQLVAPRGARPPLYLQHLDRPFWLQEIPEGLLYIQLNQVRNGPDVTLAQFARTLRQRLSGDNVRVAVLDVRHNHGGEAGLLPELIRTFIHFETSNPNRQLYVLTSRNTFSAAQTLLNLMERLTSALFVGEPSGTRPNRLGNESPFQLPFSGVSGSISSGYNQGWTSRDERQWIAPHVPIALSSQDYFAGRDPALETILHLEASRQSAVVMRLRSLGRGDEGACCLPLIRALDLGGHSR